MEFRQIEYFCKTCQWKSISAAAREFNISEQAVSKALANLEREIGFKLLNRTARGIELTAEGEELLPKAENLLLDSDVLRESTWRIRKGLDKQRLSVGTYEGFVGGENDPLPIRLIVDFKKKHPDAIIELYEDSSDRVMDKVRDGSLDVGVFVGAVPPDCDYLQIAKISLWAVIGKKNPLSKKKSISLHDLDGQEVIMLHGKRSMMNDLMYLCETEGAVPIMGNTVLSLATAMYLTYESNGIVIVDRRCSNRVDTRHAVFLPLESDNIIIRPPVNIIWRKDFQLGELHKQIIDMIKGKVSDRVTEVKDLFSAR